MEYEEIKNIIQQYADKGMNNFNEASAKEGNEASCTKFWDGFSQCANLLLLEVLDKKPKFELSQEQKREIFDEVLNMAEPELIDDSVLPKLYSEMDLKEFSEEWDGSMYSSDAIIAGAKWMNNIICSEIEKRLQYMQYAPHRADTYKELKSLLSYIKSYV